MSHASPIDPALIGQLSRYVTVGFVSNLMLYGLYLALTAVGADPKATMSALYAMGMLSVFVANRRWSFRHEGSSHCALARYFIAQAAGYATNLTVLVLLVDVGGIDHRYAQGAAMVLVAVQLFLMQRLWVFRSVRAG